MRRGRRVDFIAVLLIGLLCSAVGCKDGKGSSSESKAQTAPEAAPKSDAAQKPAPPAPSDPTEASDIALARFKGDNLKSCASVSVTIEGRIPVATDEHHLALAPEQLCLALLDEAVTVEEKGEGVLNGAGKATLTRLLAGMAGAVPPKNDKARQWLVESAKTLTWPMESMAAQLKKGELARVESCAFPDRTSLGICRVEDSFDGTDTSIKLTWSIEWTHFDVESTTDSDAAFKRCVTTGGAWSAPDKDDPAAARERMKQRARDLRGLGEE